MQDILKAAPCLHRVNMSRIICKWAKGEKNRSAVVPRRHFRGVRLRAAIAHLVSRPSDSSRLWWQTFLCPGSFGDLETGVQPLVKNRSFTSRQLKQPSMHCILSTAKLSDLGMAELTGQVLQGQPNAQKAKQQAGLLTPEELQSLTKAKKKMTAMQAAQAARRKDPTGVTQAQIDLADCYLDQMRAYNRALMQDPEGEGPQTTSEVLLQRNTTGFCRCPRQRRGRSRSEKVGEYTSRHHFRAGQRTVGEVSDRRDAMAPTSHPSPASPAHR